MPDLLQYGALGLAAFILAGLYLLALKLGKPLIDAHVEKAKVEMQVVKEVGAGVRECLQQFSAHEQRDETRHGIVREDLKGVRYAIERIR